MLVRGTESPVQIGSLTRHMEAGGLHFTETTLIPGAFSLLVDHKIVLAPKASSERDGQLRITAKAERIRWGRDRRHTVPPRPGLGVAQAPIVPVSRDSSVGIAGYLYRINYVRSTSQNVTIEILSHHNPRIEPVEYNADGRADIRLLLRQV